MKTTQYIIGCVLIFYNIFYLVNNKYGIKYDIDSKFNRITLSILLFTFILDGLISGNLRFRSYDVARDNNKPIFYFIIIMYIVAIGFLLLGL